MPFIYLPDAVSLFLLVIALTLLRRVSTIHFRLEMSRLRDQVVFYWSRAGLPSDKPAYLSLCRLLASVIGSAPRISPARLFFTDVCCRRLTRMGRSDPLPDPMADFDLLVRGLDEESVRERLRHFRMEMVTRLGVFLLLGSISGWGFLLGLFSRVLWRTVRHRRNDRVDRALDFSEKLISRAGRRAQWLALITEPA